MAQPEKTPQCFACPQCGNRVEYEMVAIGKKPTCPRCGAELAAVPPTAAGHQPVHDDLDLVVDARESGPARNADDGEYSLRVTAEPEVRRIVPSFSEDVASERPIAEATRGTQAGATAPRHPRDSVRRGIENDDNEENDEEEPLLPWQTDGKTSLRRLFLVDTFRFPFRLNAMGPLLLLAAMALPPLLCAEYAAMMAQRGSAASDPANPANLVPGAAAWTVFLAFGLFFLLLGFVWAILAAPIGLAVVRDTSSGCDKIEWPGLIGGEFFNESLTVFLSVCYAALPGLIVTTFGQWQLVTRLWVVAVSVPVFFPIVLLSALEVGSPYIPFSWPLWRNLGRTWRAWLVFYPLSLGAIAVLVAVPTAFAFRGYLWTGTALGCCALSIGWLLYFRLIGRLTWYCLNPPNDTDASSPLPPGEG